MNPWMTNVLLLVIYNHKSRVGGHEGRQCGRCSRFMSVVCGLTTHRDVWWITSSFPLPSPRQYTPQPIFISLWHAAREPAYSRPVWSSFFNACSYSDSLFIAVIGLLHANLFRAVNGPNHPKPDAWNLYYTWKYTSRTRFYAIYPWETERISTF
jgi:hypothetical protein